MAELLPYIDELFFVFIKFSRARVRPLGMVSMNAVTRLPPLDRMPAIASKKPVLFLFALPAVMNPDDISAALI